MPFKIDPITGRRFTSRRNAETQVQGVVRLIANLRGRPHDKRLKDSLGRLSQPELQAMFRDEFRASLKSA